MDEIYIGIEYNKVIELLNATDLFYHPYTAYSTNSKEWNTPYKAINVQLADGHETYLYFDKDDNLKEISEW